MEQAAARAEQRTLATSEAVLQLERDVAQQLHRHLERIASFETDRLGAAVARIHGLQARARPRGGGMGDTKKYECRAITRLQDDHMR